jgi:hypothetical protein
MNRRLALEIGAYSVFALSMAWTILSYFDEYYSYPAPESYVVFIIPLVIGIVIFGAGRGSSRSRFAAVLGLVAILQIIFMYAAIYRSEGIINMSDKNIVRSDPDICLYFSIVTFTTLGYGDFAPTPPIRLLAASEALVGYVSMALLIALFARAWSQLFGRPAQRWYSTHGPDDDGVDHGRSP